MPWPSITQGRLLAGTGNRGHIFAMQQRRRLQRPAEGGVFAGHGICQGSWRRPVRGSAATSERFSCWVRDRRSEGTYESDVFDAKIFSRWGRAELRGAGNVELFARSGNVDNPDRNWSSWMKVDPQKDGETGRVRRRVSFSGKPCCTREIRLPGWKASLLNYLSKNIAPDIDDVGVQIGTRYQPLPKPLGATTDMSWQRQTSGTAALRTSVCRRRTIATRLGVKWVAHDDNDDQLSLLCSTTAETARPAGCF